ncbi:hypothetical protein J3R82DRAFT_9072 [Butyriboletus roseoflavus]|nr:hypothetical protein J3R82DRAFT_9072 [Butyriboletus roseoflavus]
MGRANATANSHHPASPPSVKALAMLRASLSAPYPPSKPNAPPLEFNFEVIESKPPTPDQLRTILSYVTPKDVNASYSTFLSSHPGLEEQPESAADVAELGAQDPNALKWPMVVDWNGGRASIGDVDGVAKMLEALRQRRDGEVKDEDVVEPRGWFRRFITV